ncbi:MAG: hypothetical protein G3M78_13265 [Candidatus Nitrohelix vancouverensis]|uniref:Uncharacterized protein n=1 Tax=Candidatus Nitrohelix vancouverensis TaxID=2705534 RepID=A0A7T0C490_9BACT|nr:MAG: hypothetical protein G3M78_13265 [Candidatus Nitrohelix vancouverensis]
MNDRLEALSEVVGDLSQGLVAANLELLEVSQQRDEAEPAFFHDFFFIGPLQFDLNFTISKSKSGSLLFLLKKQGPEKVLVDFNLSVRFLPVPEAERMERDDVKATELFFCSPPFIHSSPLSNQLRRHSLLDQAFRPAPSNSMLLSLDIETKGVFAYSQDDRNKKSVILCYTPPGKKTRLIENKKDSLSIEAFNSMMEILREWALWDFDEGEGALIPLSDHTQPDHDVISILQKLRETYVTAASNLDLPAGSYPPLLTLHQVDNFHSDAVLRLNADGNIAFDDEEDAFQLRMKLEAVHGEERPRMRVTSKIPDFLVGSELKDIFVSKLHDSNVLKKLRRELEKTALGRSLKKKDTFPDDDQITAYLENCSDDCLVFRTKRKEKSGGKFKDTDVIVLRGSMLGAERILILRVKFIFEPGQSLSEEFPPELDSSSLDVLFFGNASALSSKLDQETSEYFFKLFNAIYNWVSLFR